MARILLAWELGANYGHLMPLRQLAQILVAQGHQCVFAARDLGIAEEVLPPGLGSVLQAPIQLGAGRQPVKVQVSYASLLNNIGFDDPVGLAGRLRAWRQLMHATRADLMFADHAPTALLAARSLGLPAVHFGTGFVVPPVQAPFPSFRPELKVDPALMLQNEAAVLKNLNGALERLRLPPLDRLQALFDGVTQGVTSYPEMDHYALPRTEPYLGLPDFSRGLRPVWPQPRAPRIFAYLRPFKGLPPLLKALKDSRAHVLVRIGDIAASRLKDHVRPNMLITDRAVNLRLAAESCDLFINYAAHGTTCEMLLAGKPGLLLPTNQERVLVAARASAIGAALAAPEYGEFDHAAALQKLIEDPGPKAAAEAFAARHTGLDRSRILQDLASAGLRRISG